MPFNPAESSDLSVHELNRSPANCQPPADKNFHTQDAQNISTPHKYAEGY